MRVVLIVQSLIILGGAYYVYTLTRPPVAVPTENPPTLVPETSTPAESTDDSAEDFQATDDVVASSSAVIFTDGDNDLGMEFPIPDEGVLESR